MVMLFQEADMAVYTILVSSMSIVQNAVDYFFVSIHRRDILKGQLLVADVFINRHFYFVVCIAVIAGGLASFVMLSIYRGQLIEQFILFPIVLINQLALSVTLVLREIMYWNHNVKRLVYIDGGFIVAALTAVFALKVAEQSCNFMLGTIAVFLTLRMGVMVWNIERSKKISYSN